MVFNNVFETTTVTVTFCQESQKSSHHVDVTVGVTAGVGRAGEDGHEPGELHRAGGSGAQERSGPAPRQGAHQVHPR